MLSVLAWCVVVCVVPATLSELKLSRGSPCVWDGVNGTCVPLEECGSAAATWLYQEAGFEVGGKIAALPDFCSQEDKLVCCTDCFQGHSGYSDQVVSPLGVLINKQPSQAFTKCYDYFKRLPYPCRGAGNVHVTKKWDEEKKCHLVTTGVALAVGGRDAQRWEFPHMALLGYGASVSASVWLCGGAVISERYVLSAAHCATTTLGPVKFAALGLLKRTDPKENWKVYNIKSIIQHPDYKSPSKYHDIALLETEIEIVFGRDLLPACLDLGDKTVSTAEASGWGSIGHRQALADTLQVVTLREYNETECGEVFPPHRHLQHGYDHNTQMCYGSHYRVVDTCEGDSGGPLQTSQYKCLYSVSGVTSFGKSCGTLGSPGVYTRVAHYVPWIESVVWPREHHHPDEEPAQV